MRSLGGTMAFEEEEIKSGAIREAMKNLRKRLEHQIKVTSICVFLLGIVVLMMGALSYISNTRTADEIKTLQVNQEYYRQMAKSNVDALTSKMDRDYTELKYGSNRTLPVASPTPEPTKARYSAKITKAAALTTGKGSYILRMEPELDPNGKYDKDAVWTEIVKGTGKVFGACNSSGGNTGFFGTEAGGREVYGYSGSKEISQQCWDAFEAVTGQKPSDHLSASIVKALQDVSKVGGMTTLFIQTDGKIIGMARELAPSYNEKPCFKRSLALTGWDEKTPYFPVDPFDKNTYPILYAAAATHNQWDPDIPDLCGAGNLVPTVKPDWLDYSWEAGDAHVFRFKPEDKEVPWNGTEAVIHTDPAKCELHTEKWEAGRFLLEVKNKSRERLVGTVKEGDLVLLGGYSRIVYVTIREGKLQWLKPADPASEDYSVYAGWLAPMIDGVYPWGIVERGTPSVYTVNGVLHPQSKPQTYGK